MLQPIVFQMLAARALPMDAYRRRRICLSELELQMFAVRE